MAPRSDWWYALLGAAPRSSAEEVVNVGVITGNGSPTNLESIPGLPRLESLVTAAVRLTYEELVTAVRERIEAGTDLASLRVMVGPQLVVSAPRRLLVEPDDAVLSILRRRFLDSPKDRFVREVREALNRSEHEVDKVIQRHLPAVGIQYHRRVAFGQLYPEMRQVADFRIPQIARAVRTDRRDVLIDGVFIGAGREKEAVRTAATRIGKAFWYYRRIRDDVKRVIGRDIQTIGVVSWAADASAPISNEVADARDYIAHIWRQDADLVIDSADPASSDALASRMTWLQSRP